MKTQDSILSKVLKMKPEEVLERMKKSNIGPTFLLPEKLLHHWKKLNSDKVRRKYVVCHAIDYPDHAQINDYVLREKLGELIEGITLVAYLLQADHGLLCLSAHCDRGLISKVEEFLDECRNQKLVGSGLKSSSYQFHLTPVPLPSLIVSQEKSALFSLLEGEDGHPNPSREYGLNGDPTVLFRTDEFINIRRWVGRIFSPNEKEFNEYKSIIHIAGDVVDGGFKEVPTKNSLVGVIDDYCGGMKQGASLKYVRLGGPLMPVIEGRDCYSVHLDDLRLSEIMQHTFSIPELVVFGSREDTLKPLDDLIEFGHRMNCGYCTPCREGSYLLKHKNNSFGDEKELNGQFFNEMVDLSQLLEGNNKCSFGDQLGKTLKGAISRLNGIDLAIDENGKGV